MNDPINKHSYRIHYSTAEEKPLKYRESVAAFDEQDALRVADSKYQFRRPKTAARRAVVKVVWTAHTLSTQGVTK